MQCEVIILRVIHIVKVVELGILGWQDTGRTLDTCSIRTPSNPGSKLRSEMFENLREKKL